MKRVLLAALCLVAMATGASAQTPPDTTAPPATAAATARPGLGSWTSDRRDFRVGDIVTILVDEVTIASADKTNLDAQGRSMDLGGSLDVPSSGRRNASLRTRLENESATRGQARRRDVMTTELSARIVEMGDGVLRLEGSRSLHIDRTEQRVTLSGWARPEDISPRNFVDSWRLADVELLYESRGDLGNPKKGILARILGIFWP